MLFVIYFLDDFVKKVLTTEINGENKNSTDETSELGYKPLDPHKDFPSGDEYHKEFDGLDWKKAKEKKDRYWKERNKLAL